MYITRSILLDFTNRYFDVRVSNLISHYCRKTDCFKSDTVLVKEIYQYIFKDLSRWLNDYISVILGCPHAAT